MKKKLLISTALAVLLCSASLIGVSFSHDSIKADAAQHIDNFDDYKYSGTYYSGIDILTATEGLNGSLRKSLTTLIKPSDTYAYSGGLAKELQGADADPTNSSNMIYFYTRDSVKKNSASTWNREHVWPQNLSNGCWGKTNAGADMLHIRPTYDKTNSRRSNLKYGNQNGVGQVTHDGMNYGWAGSYFEPLDSVKGDAARDIMYVWVAWNTHYGTSMPSITNVFQSFDVLMQWHILDKPDKLEGNRNDYAQKSNQKNRNPFVDHPEYAWKIFGEKCSSSVLQAAKEAYPAVEVKATGVNISSSSISMKEGERTQLTATVLPDTATNKKVTWSSADSTIATVSSTGLVIGKKQGSTTVTVKTDDGGFTKTCSVQILDGAVKVTGVSLEEKEATINLNSYKNLGYTISPSNATNKIVSWKSSTPSVATVDENGKVSAVSEGTSTITITTDDGGFQDTCLVTCEKGVIHVQKVTLSSPNISMKIGDNRLISPIIEPDNANNKNVIWSNTNPSCVECSKGFLKGLSEGTAIITVTTEDGGLTSTCVVKVSDPDKPVTGVTLSSKTLSLVVGNKATLTATVNPSDARDTSVTWSSSDSSIADVDSTGCVRGIKTGSVTITVMTNDGGFTDTCAITVTEKGQKGDPTKGKGCSSSIIASSIIISISAITGIVGIALKKRKEI